MRVLVTGGTGFLGRAVVQSLHKQDIEVRVLGRNPTVCDALRKEGVEVVVADLTDSKAVEKASQGMDFVCHAGALSAPWGSRKAFEDTNVGGTSNIIQGCKTHGVQRLVYISSPSVVFDGQDCVNQKENAPYPARYLSIYSETKKRGEELVNAAQNDFETVILRPKAIFGPGDTSLLPRLLKTAQRGRLPQIGDGNNLIDITYVDNVVHAICLALQSKQAVGNTYTITNGESVRLWDLIRRVLKHSGLNIYLRRIPYRTAYTLAACMESKSRFIKSEPLLTRYTVSILARTQTYDITAAKRDLNYTPLVSVEEGIVRTLASLE